MTPYRPWPQLVATLLILAGAAHAAQTWTIAWSPDDSVSTQSAGNDSGTHESESERPPCTEWDDYAREWKKIYDPDTQGCCVHPVTGEEIITDNPEHADMTEVAEEKGYCREGVAGVTFCYNGEKVGLLCPYGKSFHPNIQVCLQAHENVHVRDQNLSCINCDTRGTTKSAEDRIDGECAAYEATLRCLLTPLIYLSDVPEDELEFVWNEAMRGADYFCNRDNFPFL